MSRNICPHGPSFKGNEYVIVSACFPFLPSEASLFQGVSKLILIKSEDLKENQIDLVRKIYPIVKAENDLYRIKRDMRIKTLTNETEIDPKKQISIADEATREDYNQRLKNVLDTFVEKRNIQLGKIKFNYSAILSDSKFKDKSESEKKYEILKAEIELYIIKKETKINVFDEKEEQKREKIIKDIFTKLKKTIYKKK